MKSIPKINISFNSYHLSFSTVLDRQANTTIINIKTTHAIVLTSFSNFLSFSSCVFIFFVFCISSNKLDSVLCGICLLFKSGYLELFCKTTIQLSSTGIFLGLWSRGPRCSFTEQLFFYKQLISSTSTWSS